MHARHSEVVYLDYRVVALCVLIVSSSSTNISSSNKGDNGSNEEGEIVRGAEPYRFEPLTTNRGGAEADRRDDVLSSQQRAIDRF